jgi:hypothetical protein
MCSTHVQQFKTTNFGKLEKTKGLWTDYRVKSIHESRVTRNL